MAQSSDEGLHGLRCSICLETFKEPKVLPCCHTFCKDCLAKLPLMKKPESELSVRGEPPTKTVDHEDTSPDSHHIVDSDLAVIPVSPSDSEHLVDFLTCPQCRAEHKVFTSGVDGFLNDYIIDSQLTEQFSSSKNVRDLACDECESPDPVVAFCKDCFEYLCDFCSKAHMRQKKFVGHNMKDLADQDTEAREMLPRKVRTKYMYFCPRHLSEVIQLYCKQCNTVVCNKCIVSTDHSGHKFTEVDSNTRKEVDEQLLSLSATVDEDLKTQMKNLKYVCKVEKVTNDMAADVQREINSTFDSYAAALEARRTELLAESENKCSTKMKVLWSERDRLERTIADMTSVLQFTERVRKCKDSKEFLLLTSQVLHRLRKLESWVWSDETVEAVERYSLDFCESDLDVDLASKAGELEEDQIPLYKIEFRDFNHLLVAALGKQQSFTIHITKGKCCHPWTYIETPSVTIKHMQSKTCDVADISITDADHLDVVQLLEPESYDSMDDEDKWEITNTWIITFTPYCGGHHTLTVEVSDIFDRVTKEEMPIVVNGNPPIGSQVIRGPNWPLISPEGKVLSYDKRSKTVQVKRVGHRHNKTFSWGKDDRYEIQLRH